MMPKRSTATRDTLEPNRHREIMSGTVELDKWLCSTFNRDVFHQYWLHCLGTHENACSSPIEYVCAWLEHDLQKKYKTLGQTALLLLIPRMILHTVNAAHQMLSTRTKKLQCKQFSSNLCWKHFLKIANPQSIKVKDTKSSRVNKKDEIVSKTNCMKCWFIVQSDSF